MTLIEALISILIFTLGIIPVLFTITTARGLSSVIRNDLVAANLAQEGVEVVRSIRDANWFNGVAYDTNLADCGSATCDWRIQWDSTTPLPLSTNPPLQFDLTTGIYSYTTGNITGFTRKISISRVGTCNCEIKILSQVTWPEKRTTRILTVESHLFNWR